MSQDALLIAQAISQLKQEINPLKDYIFPLAVSFLSAFFGGVSAYYFNRRQENIKNEREKVSIANKTLILMLAALNELIAIKSNYYMMTSTEPIERALSLDPVVGMHDKLKVDVFLLGFVKYRPTENIKFYKRFFCFIKHSVLRRKNISPSDVSVGYSWRNYNRINACVSNCNYIFELLATRLPLDTEIKDSIVAVTGTSAKDGAVGKITVSKELFLKTIKPSTFVRYIDITETIISLIDHVIIELDSFMREFPEIAQSNIDLKLVGKGFRLVVIKNDSPLYLNCLKPINQPDFELISKYIGMPVDEAEKRFTF
ncbi:hypothetical protein ACN0IV_11510 [Trabulsiella odontotermitis]|uniref:hypothetical protein n=1 Tax=Trabulsiella odontotermitis TaxID=379893 RepID=UPI003AC99A47